MESAPTKRQGLRPTGERHPLRYRRGRCSHRPGDPALPQVSAGGINPSPTTNGGPAAKPDSRNHPGGRRAGCPHPAGLCAAANTHGRIWNPPLRNGKVRGQPGSRTLCDIAHLCRGRCLHRPEDLAPPQVSAGGINPSPTTNGDRTAATTRTSVGRDALIPPGPAAKQPPNFELQRKVRRAAAFSGPPPSSCIPPARRA